MSHNNTFATYTKLTPEWSGFFEIFLSLNLNLINNIYYFGYLYSPKCFYDIFSCRIYAELIRFDYYNKTPLSPSL